MAYGKIMELVMAGRAGSLGAIALVRCFSAGLNQVSIVEFVGSREVVVTWSGERLLIR
jgi:hypothetical protein